MAGRPSIYSDEIGDIICARLAEGESLVKICRDEGMPSTVTIYRWLRTIEQFCNNYTRAKEDQAETMADQILEIADNEVNEPLIDQNGNVARDSDGNIVFVRTKVSVQHAHLRVETRKWIASKLKPKKFGTQKEEIKINNSEADLVETINKLIDKLPN